MTTGGNNAINATLDATCPLTGEGCSMSAGGTLGGWKAMENPGCSFSCPIDGTIDIQCTTGGFTNRQLDGIDELGLGGQSESCSGQDYDCSTTFNVGSAAMNVRCSYTD